jgi:hypothetical protein
VLANYGPDMEGTATSTNRDSFVRMIERYNAGDLDGYLVDRHSNP